ncbi:MAG TPA: energy-coupling factor transporter ATPase [Gelria sp.]|nr:energy-coupling factor transporter ATPase [Gelria sp.]
MSFILENVTFTYQKDRVFAREAIKGLHLTINDGEILGIMGAAGSGKSTFLQLLIALLKPEEGKIFYKGSNLSQLKRRELVTFRQEVGMVFQYPEQQIFADLVYDEIAFGPRNMKLNRAEVKHRVREAMHQTGLDYAKYHQRRTSNLSSGEKRRVAIASVLAVQPRYLLLDEPTAGLDMEGRRAILGCLKDLNQRDNVTIVMVTHHLSHLLAICQRLLVLDKGRAVLDMPIGNLLENYEDLRDIGIKLPAHLEVAYRLQQRGFHFSGQDLSPTGIAREIAEQLRSVN